VTIPILVAVAALVIEYWLIQPLRKWTESGRNVSNTRSTRSSTTLINNLLFLSGIISILAVIAIIYNSFNLQSINVWNSNINLPRINFSGAFSDANVSFAAIIYSTIISSLITSSGPRWTRFIAVIALPSTLVALWSASFFRDNWLVLLLCLLGCNFWISITSLAFHDNNLNLVIRYLSLLFPANALFLISIGNYNSLAAWIASFMILILLVSMAMNLSKNTS
jgi:hypothetical protein